VSDVATKRCFFCRKDIDVTARACPHCRQWQGVWGIALYGTILAVFVGGFGTMIWARSVRSSLFSSEEFSDHRSDLNIVESIMHYAEGGDCPSISTVGRVRNDGDIPWKDLYLEVRYYDADGKLVDATTDHDYGSFVPAHGEAAFRLSVKADKPKEVYARHEVIVQSARDGRSRF
jgi:hypothetical protein